MTPWDELVSSVDRLATSQEPIDPSTEGHLAALIERAQEDRSVDRELRAADTARWLVGLALAHRGLRERDTGGDPDLDGAQLRMITTRWLHPARPRA